MSKLIPGPWRASGPTGPNMQSYSQPWAVTGTGENRAVLICGCFGDIPGGKEAAEAHARLIAAAPETAAERDRLKEERVELLSTLLHARVALVKAGHHSGVSGVMIDVDNAIEKLKGE